MNLYNYGGWLPSVSTQGSFFVPRTQMIPVLLNFLVFKLQMFSHRMIKQLKRHLASIEEGIQHIFKDQNIVGVLFSPSQNNHITLTLQLFSNLAAC